MFKCSTLKFSRESITRGANPVVVKGWNAWNCENGRYEWVLDTASMAKVLANKVASKCKPLIALIRPVRYRYVNMNIIKWYMKWWNWLIMGDFEKTEQQHLIWNAYIKEDFYIVLVTADQTDTHQYQKQNQNHAIIKLWTWYPHMNNEL